MILRPSAAKWLGGGVRVSHYRSDMQITDSLSRGSPATVAARCIFHGCLHVTGRIICLGTICRDAWRSNLKSPAQ